ncbi:MAG: diacylglycerol kinase family protein [Planctomycetaceae bacterium]
MHITLIHNPNSGDEKHSRDELLNLLRSHGYEPAYQSIKDDGWEHALDEPGEMVVAAGGDGTVDDVMMRFAERGVPLGILPLGTANNIAWELGITGEPADIIAGWKTARRKKFDLGVARGPWGKMHFVEALGVGAFAHLMPILAALGNRKPYEDRKDHLQNELTALKVLVEASRAANWEIELDGEKLADEFLLLEVMNISTIGPGLQFAPDADPGDGLLDVVLIEEGHRKELMDYLSWCIMSSRIPANFPVRRAQRVQFRWQGSMVHVDSSLWSASDERMKDVKKPKKKPPCTIDIRLMPQALELLVPR